MAYKESSSGFCLVTTVQSKETVHRESFSTDKQGVMDWWRACNIQIGEQGITLRILPCRHDVEVVPDPDDDNALLMHSQLTIVDGATGGPRD